MAFCTAYVRFGSKADIRTGNVARAVMRGLRAVSRALRESRALRGRCEGGDFGRRVAKFLEYFPGVFADSGRAPVWLRAVL